MSAVAVMHDSFYYRSELEVFATELRILNEAETTPFYIEENIDTNDALRLIKNFKSNNALIWSLHIFLMQQKSSKGGDSCERKGTLC